jgi:hypothetical protein
MNSDELDTEALQLFDRKAICDEMPVVNDAAARAMLRLFDWEFEFANTTYVGMWNKVSRTQVKCKTPPWHRPGCFVASYDYMWGGIKAWGWNDIPAHIVMALYDEAVRRGVL